MAPSKRSAGVAASSGASQHKIAHVLRQASSNNSRSSSSSSSSEGPSSESGSLSLSDDDDGSVQEVDPPAGTPGENLAGAANSADASLRPRARGKAKDVAGPADSGCKRKADGADGP